MRPTFQQGELGTQGESQEGSRLPLDLAGEFNSLECLIERDCFGMTLRMSCRGNMAHVRVGRKRAIHVTLVSKYQGQDSLLPRLLENRGTGRHTYCSKEYIIKAGESVSFTSRA